MKVDRITVRYEAKVDIGAQAWEVYLATNPKYINRENRKWDNRTAEVSMEMIVDEGDSPREVIAQGFELLRGEIKGQFGNLFAGMPMELTQAATVNGAQTYETTTIIGREEEWS